MELSWRLIWSWVAVGTGAVWLIELKLVDDCERLMDSFMASEDLERFQWNLQVLKSGKVELNAGRLIAFWRFMMENDFEDSRTRKA